MRHHSKNKKFGLQRDERNALFHALLVALITHKKITTTETRAKALRGKIEKLVTRARRGALADQRLLLSRLLNNKAIVQKLMKDIAPKYKERKGGYTRITKLGRRSGKGDASALATIEFI
ncbi:MAG: 50S ribosomal protein L17 [bacterium]|nr:50S ribosomal protein L17 [bacterium]